MGITLRLNKEGGAGKEQAGPPTKGAESQSFLQESKYYREKSNKRFTSEIIIAVLPPFKYQPETAVELLQRQQHFIVADFKAMQGQQKRTGYG